MPPDLATSSLSTGWNQMRATQHAVPEKFATGKSTAGSSAPATYKESFEQAHNYWAYAHKILPAAQAGDAEAQFYLARSMERCSEDNPTYFQHRGATLTLDEGLQYAAKRHLPMEVAQTVYERCHEFLDHHVTELGSAADWLAKATKAGQPLAQTTTATKIVIHNSDVSTAQAGGLLDAGPPVGAGADPRELLRAAVESKDPEVLFDIGSLLGVLDHSSPTEERTSRFAWWLVACQRGLDCTANSDWVKNTCLELPQCASASSPSDRVRSLAGDDWSAVQQRAQEINAGLDAGRWDALFGLGP
jgi:hypothetical protein